VSRAQERWEAGQGHGDANNGGQLQQGQPIGVGDVGQAQGAGENGGFFPNPGDPEYQNWVAGGVGH